MRHSITKGEDWSVDHFAFPGPKPATKLISQSISHELQRLLLDSLSNPLIGAPYTPDQHFPLFVCRKQNTMTMSGGGGYYKYRCKNWLTYNCEEWVWVNGTACTNCLVWKHLVFRRDIVTKQFT